jgi:NAD(P)-dependent dehydrogenase (short-subunit alcohol dehydrogenase family)
VDSLDKHVLIITGGSGAIGRPICQAFARTGAKLAVADRHVDRNFVEQLGGLPLDVDLSVAPAAQGMVRSTLEHYGRLDGLIHVVGGFAMGKLHEVELELYDRMFDINVRTLFHALRAVLPPLIAQKSGFICGFASEPAWTGKAPMSSLYGAAKSAVATLLRSLDPELKGTAVDVTILYPMGAVDTPANRRDMPGGDPSKWIDPGEIAQALVFAASRTPRGRVSELPVFPPRA